MNLKTGVAIDKFFTDLRDKQEALSLFDKFAKAWNKIKDQGIPMMEGCDEINLNEMSLNCIFLNSCITTTKKDSTGFIGSIVLKYLLSKQNKVLDKICALEAFKDSIKDKEPFMKLKAY